MSFLSILDSIFLEPFKFLIEFIFYLSYKLSKNVGVSILSLAFMLTIIMKIERNIINKFQTKYRLKQQKLANKILFIKNNYSGDEKTSFLKDLYKKNHHSPLYFLSDYLYAVFEIPLFISLYMFLPNLFIIQNAPFGILQNLASADKLISIGNLSINVLPFLVLATSLASILIYSKNNSLQSKIQLCLTPAILFIFLYNASSALVLFWLIYNSFSLLQTIAFKFKKSRIIINLSISALGIMILIAGIFNKNLLILGAILQLPILFSLIKLLCSKIAKSTKFTALNNKFFKDKNSKKTTKKQFIIITILITLFIGVFIPSTYIAASPQEYINANIFFNPLLYILQSFFTAFGCFMVWLQLIYWISNKKTKNILTKMLFVLSITMLINYMFFGLNLGIISASLKYEMGFYLNKLEVVINCIVFISLLLLSLFAYKSLKSYLSLALSAIVVILSTMSVFNVITSVGDINDYKTSTARVTSNSNLNFSLSTTGHNIVVIMLDRALGQYVPFILKEKPELKEKYDGFTYYQNTISFGFYTNICTPSMLAGYEYTPVELNKRDDEYLKDKSNEANLMLPRLFSQSGYQVTVSDPPYVDYSYFSDLSIYNQYKNINAFYSIGKFVDNEQIEYFYEITSTNFFRFSLMKTLPLLAQYVIYDKGNYNNIQSTSEITKYSNQNAVSTTKATGISGSFMNNYLTLTNMKTMTQVTSDNTNTFLFIRNDLPHEIMLLDAENNYTPNHNVDNTEYDKKHTDRFNVNGIQLKIKNSEEMAHYHSTAASLIQLTHWFDHLKATGTYDNTRIIVVSDHGRFLNTIDELKYKNNSLEGCCPLLMVKDFNETGFKTSQEFMTNADVATLATQNLGFEARNPFTGKLINMDEKFAHKQFISTSMDWNVSVNNGKTFKTSKWLSFDSTKKNCNIYDLDCWDFLNKNTILKENKFK